MRNEKNAQRQPKADGLDLSVVIPLAQEDEHVRLRKDGSEQYFEVASAFACQVGEERAIRDRSKVPDEEYLRRLKAKHEMHLARIRELEAILEEDEAKERSSERNRS